MNRVYRPSYAPGRSGLHAFISDGCQTHTPSRVSPSARCRRRPCPVTDNPVGERADYLTTMMCLMRKHVAEHGCPGGPGRCPTAARELAHASRSAGRKSFLDHFQASRCALTMRSACLLDRATGRVERRRALEIRGGVFDPDQTVVVEMGENAGKRASFPAVFLYWTGTPRSRVEVRQQKLIHGIIRGVRFQQHFTKLRFGSGSAASHRHDLQFIRRKLGLHLCEEAGVIKLLSNR